MPVNTLPLLVKVKFGSEGRNGRNLTQPPPMVGQTCRFAPISPPASAAMLAEPWAYARQNIAPLVLVEVWAARPSYPAAQQRRPTHCTDCLWELVLYSANIFPTVSPWAIL